jgi:hypothetical protein
LQELHLPILNYPHRDKILSVVDGRMVTEEEAAAINRSKAAGAAFNQRERDYLKRHPDDGRLSGLYLDRYIEKITDEYQPFGVGLDDLDALSLSELLQRDGASEAAIHRLGSSNSALHTIWKSALLRVRKVSLSARGLYRVKGGNQEYERLCRISVPHIYNLRKSGTYRKRRIVYQSTRPASVSIGERRKPDPQGRPGYLRIDTVHQGDRDGIKGVYHVNAVDEVTQWQVVGTTAQISEACPSGKVA